MPAARNSPVDLNYLRARGWWKYVDQREGDDECWPWLRSTASHGYGQTYDGITVRLAHRVAWALHHDRQVPDDMTIDHICRNRICCRPSHLRVLSNADNATDNGQGRKTHCPKGHPYDEENTVYSAKGHRLCLACRIAANRARYV